MNRRKLTIEEEREKIKDLFRRARSTIPSHLSISRIDFDKVRAASQKKSKKSKTETVAIEKHRNIRFYITTKRISELIASGMKITKYIEQVIGTNTTLTIDIDGIVRVLSSSKESRQLYIKPESYIELERIAKANSTTASRIVTAILENCIKKG